MIKRLLNATAGLALVASIGSSVALSSGVAYASPTERGNFRNYSTSLLPLNNSGVKGSAQLTFEGKELIVNLTASGLVPNMPHPAHIHGQLTGADAMCPTTAADVNSDGFVSVFEGAQAYGPIKLNLTSPQTSFGPPANTTLFAPFAGSPNLGDFPVGTAGGNIAIHQTYSFDFSKSADRQAYSQLKALDKQHIVVHGGYAPESVDTPGGSSAPVYDALLPVACGTIQITYGKNNTAQLNVKMSKVDASQAHMIHEDDSDN